MVSFLVKTFLNFCQPIHNVQFQKKISMVYVMGKWCYVLQLGIFKNSLKRKQKIQVLKKSFVEQFQRTSEYESYLGTGMVFHILKMASWSLCVVCIPSDNRHSMYGRLFVIYGNKSKHLFLMKNHASTNGDALFGDLGHDL